MTAASDESRSPTLLLLCFCCRRCQILLILPYNNNNKSKKKSPGEYHNFDTSATSRGSHPTFRSVIIRMAPKQARQTNPFTTLQRWGEGSTVRKCFSVFPLMHALKLLKCLFIDTPKAKLNQYFDSLRLRLKLRYVSSMLLELKHVSVSFSVLLQNTCLNFNRLDF